jgi:hypothetical protein
MRYDFGAVGLALALMSPFAAAAQCPMTEFKDEINYRKDLLTNLSYIDQVATHSDKKEANSQNVAFLDIANMNTNQASSLSSSLQRMLNIQWSQHDQEWLLVSQLTDKGLKAYYQCLETNKSNLMVHPGEGAGGKLQFLVDMQWRPNYNAPNPSIITYRLLNASVAKDAPKTIRPGESDQFAVKREDPYQPVEIGVRVDGQIYPNISLPAFPAKKIKEEVREVTEYHDVYGGGVDYWTTLCVKIPNEEDDAEIVPNTLKISTTGLVADRASLTAPDQPTYDTRNACTRVRWGLGAKDGRVYGTAHVTATVIKLVPVQILKIQSTKDIPVFEGQK